MSRKLGCFFSFSEWYQDGNFFLDRFFPYVPSLKENIWNFQDGDENNHCKLDNSDLGMYRRNREINSTKDASIWKQH